MVNSATARVNGGVLVRIVVGLVVVMILIVGYNRFFTADTQTVAQTSANQSTPSVGDTQWFDSEFGKFPLTVTSVNGDSIQVKDSEGDTFDLMYILANLVDPQAEADRNAAQMERVIEQRRQSGYYEQHKPAGWKWASEQETFPYPYKQNSYQTGLNYVPEHWPVGVRNALQYRSGMALQDWANQHLP